MNPEAAAYLERIDDLRRLVAELIADLPAEALNWRPVEGDDDHVTNSLAVMARHIAGAEHFWIHEVIGGYPPTRDRDAEFQAEDEGSAPLLELLKTTGDETRKVLGALTAVDLESSRQIKERTVPVRWGILHVIDHTALHLGHMQITYQLWQGGQGHEAPRWYERLDRQSD